MTQYNYNKLFLPSQNFFNKFFLGSKIKFEKKLYNSIENILKLRNPKKEFKLKLTKKHSVEEMASPPLSLNLYKFLCHFFKPKKILEIGTFIGISAMVFAKASGKKSKVVTIEKFIEFYKIAKKNFILNKLDKNIHCIHGDAIDVLKKKKREAYDLIFLDGDKGKYIDLFKIIEKKFIKKGSIVIIDNFFFHGDTLNKKCITPKGVGVKRLQLYIKKSKKYFKTILPIYDGIALVQKI